MKVDPRWVIGLALAEMTLVAITTLLIKTHVFADFEGLTELGRRQLASQMIALLFCPAWLLIAWAIRNRLKNRPHRFSAEYILWAEKGYALVAAMLVAFQAFMAWSMVTGHMVRGEAPPRVMVIFVGVVLFTQGNFLGKVSPPRGADAPDAHLWSRTMLRIGWGMALAGAGMVAGAILAPGPQLPFAVFLATAALTINSALQRRALRRRA